jgi:hypothetical protein
MRPSVPGCYTRESELGKRGRIRMAREEAAMVRRWLKTSAAYGSLAFALASCNCDGGATVRECAPESACMCTEGTMRATSCACAGGSTCTIDGDDIEFACDGNAACGLNCGTNCLITCPGTTSCTVSTGDEGDVTCPGTASCDITCLADCRISIAGNATAVVRCEGESSGASCDVTGCTLTDCGGGIYACRTSCPPTAADGG